MIALELANVTEKDIAHGNRMTGDAVICPICQFDLFEGLEFDNKDRTAIENYTNDQISGGKSLDEVVLMKKCKDH